MGNEPEIPSGWGWCVPPGDPSPRAAQAPSFDGLLRARLNEARRVLSYAEIGRRTGFSPETCRRYITRGTPSIEFVLAFCDATGASLHWLLTGVGAPSRRDESAEWLDAAKPEELVMAIGRRWGGLEADIARIHSRLSMLEARVGPVRQPDSVRIAPTGPERHPRTPIGLLGDVLGHKRTAGQAPSRRGRPPPRTVNGSP